MKINTNKNVEIVIHSGEMQIYVDGNKVQEGKINDNAAFVLGNLVGTLKREGVIID